MKINPYYISAAVAVVVIVVIFMSRRDNATRDWNSTNFILSADNNGNLTPITEDFFKQKEDELLAKVDAKLDNVYTKSETFTKTETNNALSKKSNNHGHDYYTKGQTYNRDQTYTRSQTNDAIAAAILAAPLVRTNKWFRIYSNRDKSLYAYGNNGVGIYGNASSKGLGYEFSFKQLN